MDCTRGSATDDVAEMGEGEEEEAVEVAEEEVVVVVVAAEMEGMAEMEVAAHPMTPSHCPKRTPVRHRVIAQSIVTVLLPGPG